MWKVCETYVAVLINRQKRVILIYLLRKQIRE